MNIEKIKEEQVELQEGFSKEELDLLEYAMTEVEKQEGENDENYIERLIERLESES